ncbi:uncharacterized protein TNCV_3268711 [Trichonephila clavipes]|nr:uncharacterized protein TNCV_3268711 [Trichonephila clavipes]
MLLLCVVSFPLGRNESCQCLRQFVLLYDRGRHHISPTPEFRHGTGGEGNILQPLAPVVPDATTHKTFGPTDLTRTYSGGIWWHWESGMVSRSPMLYPLGYPQP